MLSLTGRMSMRDAGWLPVLHDRGCLDEAAALIARFGEAAIVEAALQADASRSKGQIVLSSRWRQVEQAVQLLQLEEVVGEVH